MRKPETRGAENLVPGVTRALGGESNGIQLFLLPAAPDLHGVMAGRIGIVNLAT